MNKYTLTFKNPVVEKKYQQTSILQIRMTMFTLITLGFIVVFIIRIVQGLMQKNYINVITYGAMITYFSLQYFLAKKYKFFLRGSLILLNHIFTVYFLFVEESEDILSSFLSGANQMGSNFLIILAGEYVDAMFSFVSISGIRIAIIFYRSTKVEYSAIGSAIIVILFASRYLYQYHEAIRSQYLLTLVQESWENILSQINKQTPFILLNFDEEKLKFSITQNMNCSDLFTTDSEVLNFLRESQHNSNSMEELIYQEIKQFQERRVDQFNKILDLQYKNTLIKLEYSIYFGNKPTILLIFLKEHKSNDIPRIVEKYHDFVNTFIAFFGKLQNFQQVNQKQISKIRRKLLLAKFADKITLNKFKCKNLKLSEIFKQLASLYYEYHIQIFASSEEEIRTCPTILNFFFITVMESLQSERLTIRQSSIYQYTLIGNFQEQQLWRISQFLLYQYKLIFQELQITCTSIKLFYLEIVIQLHPQAFVPFI